MSSHDIHTPRDVKPSRGLTTLFAMAVAGAIGLAVGSLQSRSTDAKALEKLTLENAVPTVGLIADGDKHDTPKLVLPGTLQAYVSTPIHARVSGYLKSWTVDIGARVKAGQLLAAIDTPELDQQLAQTEASLNTARAHAKLADLTARRWQAMLKNDSVSQQEADEKSGDASAKQSIVAAMQADVERMRALQSFKRVTAPFSGVVTSRKTDVGDLINAGSQNGRELFTIADVHKLRLYVNAPQAYANRIRPGMVASVEVNEHPSEHFSAKVVADSRAVNEASGTVLIQLEIDNANGRLLPGDFASVSFKLDRAANTRILPASAMMFRSSGPQVATVNAEQRVKFHAVRIGRDLGQTVEIIAGLEDLTSDERIIDLPPETLAANDKVRIKQSAPPASPQSASQSAPQSAPQPAPSGAARK